MRDKTYDFDRVFGPQSSQQEASCSPLPDSRYLFKRAILLLILISSLFFPQIYDSVSDMVHEAIEGHSVTILTYGTASGENFVFFFCIK